MWLNKVSQSSATTRDNHLFVPWLIQATLSLQTSTTMYSRLCRQVLTRGLQHNPQKQATRTIFITKAQPATASLTPVDRIWKDFENRLQRFTEGVRSQFEKFNVAGRSDKLQDGAHSTNNIWPFESDRRLFAVPEIILNADGNKVYKLEIPVGRNFVPDNVKVVLRLQDFTLTISAVHDEQSHDGLQRMHREVQRQIMLPDYIDLDKVSTSLGEDGVLCLEAPVLEHMDPPTLIKEIPINYLDAQA